MKKLLPIIPAAVIISIAFIVGVIIMARTWRTNYQSMQTISVTGSAKKELVSDLGILRINITASGNTANAAYQELQRQRPVLFDYLAKQGFEMKDIIQQTPNSFAIHEFSPQGYQTNNIVGYQYNQNFEIQSTDVELIKNISLDIASLVEKGLSIYVESPQYLYTKLSDIKVEIQAAAAQDAMHRAEKIAAATESDLGAMTGARMGVLQITPLNSTMVSDYGINDVSSIEKEITAVVTATFLIEK